MTASQPTVFTVLLNTIANSTVEFARVKTLRTFWSVMTAMTNVRADKTAKSLKGDFAGNGGETYNTEIALHENGKIAKHTCTCKAAERDPNAPCKHALALAWRWINRTSDDKGLAASKDINITATPSHYWIGGHVVRETAKAVLIERNGKSSFFPKRFVEGNDVEGYLVPAFLMEGKALDGQARFNGRQAA